LAGVDVRPHLGRLTEVKGSVPHPRGRLAVELRREGNSVRGKINLPEGVRGDFVFEGRRVELGPGESVL